MSKDKLIVDEDRGTYKIGWYLAEEQEMGAWLGDSGRKPTKFTDEHHVAEAAVWDLADGRSAMGGGLFWERKSDAQKALVIARRAVAEWNGAKPWPGWAKQAQAAGWKAPKGWTP